MSRLYTWVMKMQDMATPVVDRIQRSVNRASESIDRMRSSFNKAGRSSQEFSGHVSGAKSRVDSLGTSTGFSALTEKIKRSIQSMIEFHTRTNNATAKLTEFSDLGLSSIISRTGILASLVAGFSLFAFVKDATAAYREAQNLDRVIQFTGGKEGAKNLQFVTDLARELKLPIMETKEGFKQFSAASMGTAIEGQKTRDIFKSVSIATAGMGLSGENTKGVFLALSQMMSKGKVSAEELRGQLGERLPGAFNIAAKAMGVTQSELDKMLANGQLMSEEFLPKFAAELEKTYGSALPGYFKSAQAYTNEYNNKLQEFKVKSGEALMPLQFRFMQLGTTVMGIVLPILIKAAEFINRNWGLITDTIVALTWAIGLGILAFKAHAVYTIASTIATQGFTVAMHSLNLAFLANPVTWVVVGLMAFVAAIVLAYRRVDWFRGGINGLWEAAKTVFSNIGDFFKKIFEPIFKAIDAFKRGDYAAAAKYTAQGLFNLSPVGLAINAVNAATEGQFTKGVSASYNKGYKQGVAEVAAKKAEEKKSTDWFESLTQSFNGGQEQSQINSQPPGFLGGTSGSSSPSSGGSGGGKSKSVTIHINNLVRVDSFNGSSNDGKQEVTDTVVEALIRAITGAQIVLEGNE